MIKMETFESLLSQATTTATPCKAGTGWNDTNAAIAPTATRGGTPAHPRDEESAAALQAKRERLAHM